AGRILRGCRRRLDPEGLCERPCPETPQVLGCREDARPGLEEEPETEVVRAARTGFDVDDDRSRRPDRDGRRSAATVATRWILGTVERHPAAPPLLDELVERRAGRGRVAVHAPPSGREPTGGGRADSNERVFVVQVRAFASGPGCGA